VVITRSRVEEVARDSGFRPGTVEKVLRLCEILERLDRHPTTRGQWVLKGDTALNLLYLSPGLLDDGDFRLCFVCQMAGGRHDPRELEVRNLAPDARSVDQQLLPMLRVGAGSGPPDAGTMQRELDTELSGVEQRLLAWRPAEQQFLDRLHDEGVVDAEALSPDPVTQERIRNQPMLQWKAQNVREHRRLG
jgi:hypothetical protein